VRFFHGEDRIERELAFAVEYRDGVAAHHRRREGNGSGFQSEDAIVAVENDVFHQE